MAKKFRLNKYNIDKQKSYKFCQERKTMEDDNNTEIKQLHRRFERHFVSAKELIVKSESCPKLDVLDCCKLKEHKRTKDECRVCVGNI